MADAMALTGANITVRQKNKPARTHSSVQAEGSLAPIGAALSRERLTTND
jgi:hypothetical protein